MTASDSSLGRAVAYPQRYDPSLLFAITRDIGRSALQLDAVPFVGVPFIGHDRWHAYELSWLDILGKPRIATATFTVPADSPNLIESKSFKLYLNSLNGSRFEHAQALQAQVTADLSATAGAPVAMVFGIPPVAPHDDAQSLDDLPLAIESYGPPDASLLYADADGFVAETLSSQLLKSNCPVTAQPDWAQLRIAYRGPRIDRAGLLRYIVSYRDHADFHEQCVERIFIDLFARCRPTQLSVEARYTRRGGLDINPWRATPGSSPPVPRRDLRQ